jgi:uncharacterized protein YfaS (alpha-2-macroglobulin family)
MTPIKIKKLVVNLILIISLLLGTACSLPTFGSNQPGTSPTETILPTPLPEKKLDRPALPPTLVETSPANQTVMNANEGVRFYFNQAMDQASVEAGTLVTPELPLRFEWIDPSVLQIYPNIGLAPNQTYVFQLSQTIKGANGLALPQTIERAYRTTDLLRPTHMIPQDGTIEFNPGNTISISFNQPVVSLNIESTDLPEAFTLSPPASGSGEWLNTRTYLFHPNPPLLGNVTYAATLNPDLIASNGAELAAETDLPYQWSFNTLSPRVLSVEPFETERIQPDQSFTMSFNQAMDPLSIQSQISLVSALGEKVEGTFEWNEEKDEVIFTSSTNLKRATDYTLTIPAGSLAASGTPLNSAFQETFRTVGALNLMMTRPGQDQELNLYQGFGNISLIFNTAIDPENYESLISITPEVTNLTFFLSNQQNEIYISGSFDYNTSYTINIDAEMRDKWGLPIGDNRSSTLRTGDAAPRLLVPILYSGANTIFLRPQDTAIPIQVTNIDQVQLTTTRMSLNTFTSLYNNYESLEKFSNETSQTQNYTLDISRNQSAIVNLTLRPDGTPFEPGLYLFQLSTPQLNYSESFIGVVSQTNMLMKRGSDQVTFWAVDLNTMQPIPDETITLYGKQGFPLSSNYTDESGTANLDLPENVDPYETLFAVTGEPGSPNFNLIVDSWTDQVSGWNFNLPIDYQHERAEIYIYSDRPIYRPGHIVNYRIIVRNIENEQYQLPAQSSVNVDFLGLYNFDTGQQETLEEVELSLSNYGTASGSFKIPDNATPGTYQISVEGETKAVLTFEVAEYTKPDIDLQIQFDQSEWQPDETISATGSANYYFGAPAGGQPFYWTLYAATEPLYYPNNYRAGKESERLLNIFSGPSGIPRLGNYITEGSGETDENGQFRITLSPEELSKYFDLEQRATFTVNVTLQSSSQLPITASNQSLRHPSDFYIGVRPESWTGQVNQEFAFSIRTLNTGQNPSGPHALTASFQKISYEKDEGALVSDYFAYRPVFKEVSSVDFEADAAGKARIAFYPEEAGAYRLSISGDGAVTQLRVWVGGSGSSSWARRPDQQIQLVSDQDQYQPGDQAKIFIPNPLATPALGWITFERGNVIESQIISIPGASYELNLPIQEKYAPNIFVSITLIGQSETGKPDFRQGYLNLAVEPVSQKLDVQITADPNPAHPKDRLQIELRVKDYLGRPVQGEFSVALIDKALLALAEPNAPGIFDAFYGEQRLGVRSSHSLSAYIQRIPLISEIGRGGGGEGMITPTLREDFKDTAFWKGVIITDANGTAQLEVSLPDNVTTWYTDLRGVTQDTRVGEATLDIVTSKDLIIQPVVPNFLVAGDMVRLSAVAHNNTQNTLAVSVSLQSNGFIPDNPAEMVQEIILSPGGHQLVTWWGTIDTVDAVETIFTVQSGTMEDAARPEQGLIPVLSYTVPTSFGTSGVLNEAGQILEIVDLPKSFTPDQGFLQLEMAPSLAASILDDLKSMEDYPYNFTEPILSRLLSNLETYVTLKTSGVSNELLESDLMTHIRSALDKLAEIQSDDGGWSWAPAYSSDPYITTYALLSISRADQTGILIEPLMLEKAQQYLLNTLMTPEMSPIPSRLNQLAFTYYVLTSSGVTNLPVLNLYEYHDQLDPWAKAFLILALSNTDPTDPSAISLIADLEARAIRSATGTHWENSDDYAFHFSSSNHTTAVVAYMLAKMDPASPLLTDAIRYLSAHRRAAGGWASSYETAWILTAFNETLKGTGELQANFSYSAELNGTPFLSGEASGPDTLTPVSAFQPIENLLPDAPNALNISRGSGVGNLYYRSYLQIQQPVDQVSAIDRGISIERRYCLGTDQETDCVPYEALSLNDLNKPVLVRLSLSIAEDAYYLVVEDHIPAGTQIVDTNLLTGRQIYASDIRVFDDGNPLFSGWGWWLFTEPAIYSDHIHWIAEELPAGTYELTYYLNPIQAGEFQVLPAHAYQYYFPEVEGSSEGMTFTIEP